MTLKNFHIRPLAEWDIEAIVKAAGGHRAHEDADQRDLRGADFVLGDVVIELKSLDEDGLEKPERQARLAALFGPHEPNRPVIVIDRARLREDEQTAYDRALEGPIKTAVKSSRGQLRQSREEIPETRASVLFVMNNGYTALNHDELKALVARRVRNDSSEIDGVVVGGCYFYSDTFDSYFLWPLDYVPIRVGHVFAGFDALRAAWNNFANGVMTELMIEGPGSGAVKGPVVDTQFEIDGVTYVKPSPPIGKDSDFFVHGRPRANSSGLTVSAPVALTFPGLTAAEWTKFHKLLAGTPELRGSYAGWLRHQAEAREGGTDLAPFVPIPVTVDGWKAWREQTDEPMAFCTLGAYANHLFEARIRAVIAGTRKRTTRSLLPQRYVLAVTEEIGQDKANDLSHIALVRERANGETLVTPLVEDMRIFHEYALTLACAYAVVHDLDAVLWQKDQTYGWA